MACLRSGVPVAGALGRQPSCLSSCWLCGDVRIVAEVFSRPLRKSSRNRRDGSTILR